MKETLTITLCGLVVGIAGTGLGGVLSFFLRQQGRRFLSSVLEYSVGLMLSIVLTDMLPEALQTGTLPLVCAGVALGVLCMTLAEYCTSPQTMPSGAGSAEKRRLFRTGLTLAIGIALHNLPEGLAVGSGFHAASALGVTLAITILMHNVPEGLAMAAPLRAAGCGKGKILLITCLSGAPTILGAYLGSAFGSVSPLVVSFCLALAAGAMLYVTLASMIPESKHTYSGRLPSYFNILGVLTGIIISYCI